MKYNIIITIALAITTSPLANAGFIADDYASGDDLTATKMTRIKDAVNNNDSFNKNLVKTACNTGDVVNSINADGSANCVTDQIGSGSGGSTTDYYYINGSDFRPVERTNLIHIDDPKDGRRNEATDWSSYDIHGGYAFPVTAGIKLVAHGVRLPHNSIVTGVRCYYFDNDPTYNIIRFDFNLYERLLTEKKNDFSITDPDDGNNSTSGRSTEIRILEAHANNNNSNSASTIPLNHTIDNANNAYHLLLRFDASSGYTSTLSRGEDARDRSDESGLRTYGCRIKYEH